MPTAARKNAGNQSAAPKTEAKTEVPEEKVSDQATPKTFSVGNPALDPFFQMLSDAVSSFKECDAKLAAADGDKEKAVTGYIESSSDSEIVQRREMIAKMNAELIELAEKAVADSQLSDEEKAALTTERDALSKTITNGRKAIIQTADSFAAVISKDAVLKVLEEMGDPTKSNRGRKPGATGSSLPRANVIITVNGGNLKDLKFENFSSCAAKINPSSDNPAKDLLEAFAKAAGVEFDNVKTVDKPVEFNFQPDPNGSVYVISTVPKPRQKPGPQNKPEESAKTDETPKDPAKDSDSDKVETPAA